MISDKALMTLDEFVRDHSQITIEDARQCVRGTHKYLPPLQAKKKRRGSATNQPYLITREAAREWRNNLPDA